ncbi:Cupredoxin [Neohortaea acidophila]|uniref:Cupredoxin n=1 Tax=Neohortaea acidophila TaxID=245834 RepID=A0A6A6PV03_9PEZI|nr:Cupredoxin [Neohortaea acidophila]KAF2483822.1 Cupredoxin [Neohortaea acidophila]
MKFTLLSALALPFFASAAIHTVAVGSNGLSFSPQTITAAKGDQIAFVFDGAGHTVAQGNFKSGCQPYKKGAFFSGNGPQGKTWTMTVTSTAPQSFYCSTPGHCENGMYGVINPAGANTLAAYGKLASKASGSKAPSKVKGGSFN